MFLPKNEDWTSIILKWTLLQGTGNKNRILFVISNLRLDVCSSDISLEFIEHGRAGVG